MAFLARTVGRSSTTSVSHRTDHNGPVPEMALLVLLYRCPIPFGVHEPVRFVGVLARPQHSCPV